MTEQNTDFIPSKFRIYYIHQVPGKPFVIDVPDAETGQAILDVISDLMLNLYETNQIPDYANTGGVEYLDWDGDWAEYDAEDWQ